MATMESLVYLHNSFVNGLLYTERYLDQYPPAKTPCIDATYFQRSPNKQLKNQCLNSHGHTLRRTFFFAQEAHVSQALWRHRSIPLSANKNSCCQKNLSIQQDSINHSTMIWIQPIARNQKTRDVVSDFSWIRAIDLSAFGIPIPVTSKR